MKMLTDWFIPGPVTTSLQFQLSSPLYIATSVPIFYNTVTEECQTWIWCGCYRGTLCWLPSKATGRWLYGQMWHDSWIYPWARKFCATLLLPSIDSFTYDALVLPSINVSLQNYWLMKRTFPCHLTALLSWMRKVVASVISIPDITLSVYDILGCSWQCCF